MYQIAIDRGGTFTDVFAVLPDGKIKTLKLLSSQPEQYEDAPFEAINRVCGPNNLDPDRLAIRMGTTVATNALLEHKGERTAIVLTKGFRDVFQIGNQSREDIFELNLTDLPLLYEEVLEVDERVVLYQNDCELNNFEQDGEVGISGDKVIVAQPVDEEQVHFELMQIFNKGIRSLAVAFIHSYTYPKHEEIVERIALKIGFNQVSLSSKIMPMIRYVPRGNESIFLEFF